jgi:prophage regulatory protein
MAHTEKHKSVALALSASQYSEPPKAQLPQHGLSRWNQFSLFSPIGRETFRKLVRAGKAPQPVKFSERCTAYSNQELHRFFADPLNYRVEAAK